ncbi:MAG: ATP-dependent DNA helicase RecG [Chitinophagaceae bacterium]|nr:ATP-dependent DNA helicase RecG [Chitinophagaceae bacterium]
MSFSSNILKTPIEYLKGIGPQRADVLKKELNLFTFGDLLNHFPFRHIDRTKIETISQLTPAFDFIQLKVEVKDIEVIGASRKKRLVATAADATGEMQLTWFQRINWVQKFLQVGRTYLIYGRLGFFNGQPQMIHPEMEVFEAHQSSGRPFLEPVYSSTEKLTASGLGGRQLGKLTMTLMSLIREKDIPENLPEEMLQSLQLINRFDAYRSIHFPSNQEAYTKAVKRLKFEELFIAQIKLQQLKNRRHRISKGVVFEKVGELFNQFYTHHLPFALTNAQKRVVKEIRNDMAHGKQMNRLLQGDVGSGKTIVAVLCMLLACDNGFQTCLMAPTEILAQQHFQTIQGLLKGVDVEVHLLTGSTRAAGRKKTLAALQAGEIQILIGTHAVIEDTVQFKNLGIVIIDEQHRFGVAQRAKLWKKATIPPHILVMTATPIPRTLAMTIYGDLDVSIIDELPPGRQPVQTVHRYDTQRSKVMNFLRTEIDKGRQAYIVFPLIEESAKLDYENLMQGYEDVKAYFPEPKFWISMVHGKQPAKQKETNMQRFVENDTQIMVATTVIEVGVDIPNATMMVIESAEKFGLSQLHQLRGRVGRGAEKSYCILLTSSQLSNDARERINIMTATNNGFEIAEKDLALRGPGEIDGTRQSGVLNFKLASLVHDGKMLELAKSLAIRLLDQDPELNSAENLRLFNFLKLQPETVKWSKIS